MKTQFDPFAIMRAKPGAAVTVIRQGKHFPDYAEFVRHGKPGYVIVSRHRSSGLWKSRWLKPAPVKLEDVVEVFDHPARGE